MNAKDAAEGVARAVPFELADLVAYLFLGVGFLTALDISIFGLDSFGSFLQTRPLIAATIAGVFGYLTGVTAFGIGLRIREVAKRFVPDPRAREYLESLGTDVRLSSLRKGLATVVFPGMADPPGSFMWHARIAILLAARYLPSAAAGLGRQRAFFRFHVTLVGAASLCFLAFGFAAIRDAVSRSGQTSLMWGVGTFGTAFVVVFSEHRARVINAIVNRRIVECALATAAMVKLTQQEDATKK